MNELNDTLEQSKPDQLKSVKHTGAVYTPELVASSVCRAAAKLLDVDHPCVLEPSVGEGAFLPAIQNLKPFQVTCVDQDESAIDLISRDFANVNLVQEEFLEYASKLEGQTFDLVVGNPPYVRRHNFDRVFRERVLGLSESHQVPSSMLRNAWAAFVIQSSTLLKPGGVLAFVLPYELTNVKYGHAIQDYLAQKFERLDIFLPQDKAFKHIDQDAVVMIASGRRDLINEDCLRVMHHVVSLEDLRPLNSIEISASTTSDISLEVASVLFDAETRALLKRLRGNLKTIGDYCDTRAGIVTAANSFFILTEQQVREYKLATYRRPILKRGAYLPNRPVFTKDDLQELLATKPAFLIDFGSRSQDKLTKSAQTYISTGVEADLQSRYKMRARSPWYRIPIVKPGDGFFFKRAHSFPRLCINDADVLVTDTAYTIEMKTGFEIEALCYSYYNSLSLLFSEIDGRFYGGGVLEITPNEFRGIPIVYSEPKRSEFSAFLSEFPTSTQPADMKFQHNDLMLKQSLQLSGADLARIQQALATIRNHRLRHGSSKIQ